MGLFSKRSEDHSTALDPNGSFERHIATNRFAGGLSLELPGGWFAKESVTIISPDGQANLIASSEPLDHTINTADYARIQGDLLRKEFPGYIEHAFVAARVFGGQPGFIRRFSWTPPDGVPVTQIQLYYAETGRGFTATATTPSAQFDRFESTFRQLLASLAYLRPTPSES